MSSARAASAINPDTLSIAGLTFGMLLIALVCVGGFTVVAQRRLRSLGMLASLGATDKNLGLVVRANGVVVGVVGSVLGAALGFVLWLAYRPHLESSSHHLIGAMALPWTVIALALLISVVATYLAASRPARTIAKVPIVLALSGRPAPPKQVRRSALPGLVFLALSFLLLGYSGSQDSWGHSGGQGELVLGLVLLIPAVILLAPFCLSVLARLGRRAPITVRLALRDLDRYRARSGSALAAISLGVLIAVIITIVAAARYANVLDYVGPNLAANQLIVYTPNGPGYTPPGLAPPLSATQLQAMGKSANSIATSLGAGHAVELASTSATLNHAAGGRNFTGPPIYVATPQLLQLFGVKASRLNPKADILTMRPGLSALGHMQLLYGNFPSPGQAGPAPEAHAQGQGRANGPGTTAGTQAFPCPPGSCVAQPGDPGGEGAPVRRVCAQHGHYRAGSPPSRLAPDRFRLADTELPPNQCGSGQRGQGNSGRNRNERRDQERRAHVGRGNQLGHPFRHRPGARDPGHERGPDPKRDGQRLADPDCHRREQPGPARHYCHHGGRTGAPRGGAGDGGRLCRCRRLGALELPGRRSLVARQRPGGEPPCNSGGDATGRHSARLAPVWT